MEQTRKPADTAKGSNHPKTDVREFLTFKLVTLSRLIESHSARNTNPMVSLSMPEVRLLSLIYSIGECSLKDLTLISKWDGGNTSKSTDKLVKLGYATREINLEDRRIRTIKLTKKGKITAETYLIKRQNVNKDLMACFSAKELACLKQALSKVESFFQNQAKD